MKVFALFMFVGLASVASTSQAIDWDECTNNGKHAKSTCYGFQHAVITAVVQGAMGEASGGDLYGPVGLGACMVFFGREAASDSGAFGSADDMFDWMTPCAVAFGMYKWRGTPVSKLWEQRVNAYLPNNSKLSPVISPAYTGMQYEHRF